MGTNKEWFGFTIRYEATKEFLSGHGIEIGAGANPQRLPEVATASYFDKRDDEELKVLFQSDIGYEVQDVSQIDSAFPDGADFLVAHNVLEHIHDHVGALVSWYSYLRDGAVVVISVPEKNGLKHDAGRVPTPLSHILDDLALARGPEAFETKEHIGSFCLGWSPSWVDLDRDQFAKRALFHMNDERNDLHWHANERDVWDAIIALSLMKAGIGAQMLRIADIKSDAPFRTQGEVIYTYRISRQDKTIDGLPDYAAPIQQRAEELRCAADRLSDLSSYASSIAKEP